MNFLAHLHLAGDDEALRLGALLGDFVRGKTALQAFDKPLRRGIMLHRHIDSFLDSVPQFQALRESFQPPFRRYCGIIIDLGLDHELAKYWPEFSDTGLLEFDHGVRKMLVRHADLLPPGLVRFMAYADQRGLFAAYVDVNEVLHSLRGIGTRLSHANPLHRVDEIWDQFEGRLGASFRPIMAEVQSEVDAWLNSKSTITGS